MPGQVEHQLLGVEGLQVRIVDRDPVVLGTGGELDVLGQQVQHAPRLAGGIVARGGRMAVEICAQPAGGVDRAFECGRQRAFLAGRDLECS